MTVAVAARSALSCFALTGAHARARRRVPLSSHQASTFPRHAAAGMKGTLSVE